MTDVAVIHPESVVNQHACDDFVAALHKAVADGARVLVLDCACVQYMNTRAIGELATVYKTLMSREGELRLVRPCRLLRECLEMSGLWPFLRVFDSLEAATETAPPETTGKDEA